jgi:hypothetical protein
VGFRSVANFPLDAKYRLHHGLANGEFTCGGRRVSWNAVTLPHGKFAIDVMEAGLGGEMFTIDQSSFDEHAIILILR